MSDKGVEKISSPETVYVSQEGIIYIGDTGNQRIVVLDKDKTWIRTIMFDPQQIKEMGVFVEGFRFRPRSIAEGVGKKLYVISAGIYDGIMEFTSDGDFLGFIGAAGHAHFNGNILVQTGHRRAKSQKKAVHTR